MGAFPVELGEKLQLGVNLFDADTVGFHTYVGKRFAGQAEQPGAVAGISKVIVRASSECVIEDHWFGNAQGVPATCSLRLLGPTYVDSGYAYNLAQTYWLESTPALAESAGLLTAVSGDANIHGPPIWRAIIPALTTMYIRLPVHLLPLGRIAGTLFDCSEPEPRPWCLRDGRRAGRPQHDRVSRGQTLC